VPCQLVSSAVVSSDPARVPWPGLAGLGPGGGATGATGWQSADEAAPLSSNAATRSDESAGAAKVVEGCMQRRR
jgi:hypothetical protein